MNNYYVPEKEVQEAIEDFILQDMNLYFSADPDESIEDMSFQIGEDLGWHVQKALSTYKKLYSKEQVSPEHIQKGIISALR